MGCVHFISSLFPSKFKQLLTTLETRLFPKEYIKIQRRSAVQALQFSLIFLTKQKIRLIVLMKHLNTEICNNLLYNIYIFALTTYFFLVFNNSRGIFSYPRFETKENVSKL